jgi:probable rRNA maturation factor
MTFHMLSWPPVMSSKPSSLANMLEVDAFLEVPHYAQSAPGTDWDALASRAAIVAVEASGHEYLLAPDCLIDMAIRFVDDATIQPLNLDSRGFDKPTNVLSFQYQDAEDLRALAAQGGGTLGDLVLAHETIAAEAKAQDKAFEAHVTHLIVHGTLHLLGFDHERGDAEAEDMERRERSALAQLGLADPYKDEQ